MSKTIEVSDETFEKIKDQLQEDVQKIESLDELIGKTYLFQCARYIYHGKVKTITPTYIEITKAGVVFETGEYSASEPSDKQSLPNNVFIMRQSIEAFYKMKW